MTAPGVNKPSANDILKILPDWIKEDVFYEILTKDFPEFSKVVKFSPSAAVGPCENYASIMQRIHIVAALKDGSTVSVSYIVKTSVENEKVRQMLDSLNFFPKERDMYTEILPAFEELYAKVGKIIQFGPRCKYIETSNNHITIILEDLKQRSFSNIDRLEGLDLAHITSSLKKLAEFHAVSAVYYDQIGPFSTLVGSSWMKEDKRDLFKSYCIHMDSIYAEIVSKFSDHKKYASIWPTPDKIFDWLLKAAPPDPVEFNVLTHGDCWSNNIMFQHNDQGEVVETYFVDYQVGCYGSLALDVLYMITTSAHYDLRVQEFDRLICIYHEHLMENLELLKYSNRKPSLKEVQTMMIKYSTWGLYAATTIMPLMLVAPDQNASLDFAGEGDDSEGTQISVFFNSRYVRAMTQLLPWWKNRGVFDFHL